MFNLLSQIELNDLIWLSDWNGYEVGYLESEVVGLYSQKRDDEIYNFYINIDTYSGGVE